MRPFPTCRILIGILWMLPGAVMSAGTDRADEVAELLLRSPEFSHVSLSPDGTHLGMHTYTRDQRSLGTYDLTTRKGRNLRLKGGEDVYDYGWLDADRLIYSLSKLEYYHAGLHVIDERLRTFRRIDPPGDRRTALRLSMTMPMVEGEAILVNVLARPYRELFRYRYPDGLTEISGSEEMLLGAFFDREGVFRIKRVGGDAPNESTLHHRPDEAAPWEPLDIPHLSGVHGLDPTGEILFVTHRPEKRTVFQALRLATGAFEGDPIGNPHYALDPRPIRAPETGDLLGFVLEFDRPEIVYLDPGLEQVQGMLQRALPGRVHRFIGQRGAGSLLFYSWSDRHPGVLYALDLKERSLSRVLETFPGVDGAKMAPKVPFTFPARDGTRIRGYYTLPVGADPGRPSAAPMIVIVHGGPRARDRWGFDREVQFFAHLGYAVLQVNYRGSEGMYEDLEPISFLATCDHAVEDVVDGTRWMVEQGFADADRLAIYGWSFGGYAAVACAARYPDLFRCAYAAGGVYDFVEMWQSEAVDRSLPYLEWNTAYMGDLEAEADAYRAVSPVNLAGRIKIPVHLLHGGADLTVGKRQSRLMYEALKEAGAEVTLETPAWLRHGPSNETHRIRFTKDVYRFCDTHFRDAAANGQASD